ncbi:MAG: signal peptide peptidase SppA [Acidobacteriaceae bacterium]|nr:signal peptide peptidase SppA [Acidobacteriaceae bacterium]
MWKFLLGVLIGILVTIVGVFVIVFALGRYFANKPPAIASNSVLVLGLNGDIPEAAPVEVAIPFVQEQSVPTMRDIWTSLQQAANDSRVKAVVLQPQGLITGWGKLQELHQELLQFKKSGKPVYAYLRSPGSHEYYLATAADKIFLAPDDEIDVKGFLLQALYFKGTLDKLGIQMDVDHIGRFKDAGDIYTRTNMSPESREVYNEVLDQIYGDFCSAVAKGRNKTAEDVKALIDSGPFLAGQAKAAGLVDQLGYEDDVYSELKKKLNNTDLKKTGIRTYFRGAPARGDRIALLVGEGEIVRGDPTNTFGNASTEIAASSFIKVVRQIRNDSGVKGVILRVDSPGGDAVASDEILHELKLLSNAKPLVISMSDYAASGGYFISMTGNQIVAYPDTVTGSIGVLYTRPNVKGLLDKLGVSSDMVSRGKLADMDAIDQPLSDAARQKLHDSIQATYTAFVDRVAAARKKSYDQINAIGQGRVWMGAQAGQNGLVDELGGFDQAVALIRKRAHLPPDGATNLVLYPPRRSVLEMLANSSPDALADSMGETILHRRLPFLPDAALLRGGVLRILPYHFNVQ